MQDGHIKRQLRHWSCYVRLKVTQNMLLQIYCNVDVIETHCLQTSTIHSFTYLLTYLQSNVLLWIVVPYIRNHFIFEQKIAIFNDLYFVQTYGTTMFNASKQCTFMAQLIVTDHVILHANKTKQNHKQFRHERTQKLRRRFL